METLVAAAGLVTVAALTPGPNNLVVLRAAARSGVRSALPAIAGIVLGGLLLLAVVAAGGIALFEAAPGARTATRLAGGAYLTWLGGLLLVKSFREASPETHAQGGRGPSGVAGLLAFQFLNPKSWVMALIATSAVDAREPWVGLAQLALLFALIPTVCLLLWSSLGSLLASVLRQKAARAWVDRVMGVLLLASAVLLLSEP
jgi:threonine/homoserine/homoserine lactone efflux protein